MAHHGDMPTDEARIGQLLCSRGCLTEEQLQEALAEQEAQAAEAPATPLGEICSDHGWCTMGDVAAVVLQQRKAVFRDTTLGHLLVTLGHLSLQQLEDALIEQEEFHTPLGEILVAKGFCGPEHIRAAMATQVRRRNSSLRHLTAFAFNTFNVTEIIVNQELDEILRDEGTCTCDECRANTLAIALNSIPPHYVSDHRLLMLYVERFRSESLDQIRDRIRVAAQHVRAHPKAACRDRDSMLA